MEGSVVPLTRASSERVKSRSSRKGAGGTKLARMRRRSSNESRRQRRRDSPRAFHRLLNARVSSAMARGGVVEIDLQFVWLSRQSAKLARQALLYASRTPSTVCRDKMPSNVTAWV